jgi:hypothetical protein
VIQHFSFRLKRWRAFIAAEYGVKELPDIQRVQNSMRGKCRLIRNYKELHARAAQFFEHKRGIFVKNGLLPA